MKANEANQTMRNCDYKIICSSALLFNWREIVSSPSTMQKNVGNLSKFYPSFNNDKRKYIHLNTAHIYLQHPNIPFGSSSGRCWFDTCTSPYRSRGCLVFAAATFSFRCRWFRSACFWWSRGSGWSGLFGYQPAATQPGTEEIIFVKTSIFSFA